MAYSDIFPSKVDLRDDVNILEGSSVAWKGAWVDGEYILNDLTRDGDWTMIANTTTTDRPSPQSIGVAERDTENTVFTDVTGPTDVVKMVHRYTMLQSGWMQGLWIKVPSYDVDSFARLEFINETTGKTTVKNNILLQSGEWVLIGADDVIVLKDEVFRIEFSFYNANSSNAITGGWLVSVSPTGGATVAGELIITDTKTPTSIQYNYEDLDGTDRQTELDGVTVGSIIDIVETGDSSRYIECKVTAVDDTPATGVIFTVTTLDQNKDVRDGNVTTNTINVPITAPTHYYEASIDRPTNNPSWATITSELYWDNVTQNVTNSAFGIDLQFQEASVSSDWDLVALSSSSSGSSSSSLGSYDYSKTTGYTNATTGYTAVGSLVTPTRDAGTYEVKLSMTWSHTTQNESVFFRWSMDGGVNWDELREEVKDATDHKPEYYAYPVVEAIEFIKDIRIEARSDSGTLTIDFLDIIYERKI